MKSKKGLKIGIIGLGYVGLPLAVEFALKYKVVGFDINQNRINELILFNDRTKEIDENQLKFIITNDTSNKTNGLKLSNDISDLETCTVYIVTVPTPIDKYNKPDLKPLFKASNMVANVLKNGDIVIYESTVYPGVTEEECVPILEKISNLKLNLDFFVGYSPERINPGDKEHRVSEIKKITSGSTILAANLVDDLYKSIIKAGTYKAASIKVAEAAKVIENAQRDINIAFVNELSKIFNLLKIDTNDVLDAASTKWNFLKFKPGLVGGHCIGVDPYYLAQRAQEFGYHPEIILAGRRINDSMGKFIATEVVKLMIRKNIAIYKAKILILGFTFKENCCDVRNTKVLDIINELNEYDLNLSIYDPWAISTEVNNEYGIEILTNNHEPTLSDFDAIILAVAHDQFKNMNIKTNNKSVVYDVKGILPINQIDGRL